MKRILFSLLAGLVSLSLAGCTPAQKLAETLTPTPTPIEVEMINEIGTPTEVLQFSGSSDSLRPMMEAVTNQLGFTPAEGELAGFTVKGTTGEGNYFFVSHDGAVYTIFAHAEGGRFATVKVDGANKTSDFAIFEMIGITLDPSTELWGINDGHGGIASTMFVFTLNSDGSVKSVAFSEPKSGQSIQVSESTTQISFERKALFKPRVPLGGDEVAYLWDSNNVLTSLPEGATDILDNPSDPDVWKQPTGYVFSDGTPFPWGEFVVVKRSNGRLLFEVPVLVRGVVEVPNPRSQTGAMIILPVLEVPAQGASNFIILNLLDGSANIGVDHLLNGIPPNWAQSSVDDPLPVEDFMAGYKLTNILDNRQTADLLRQNQDKAVIVSFSVDDTFGSGRYLKQMISGKLISPNGQSGVDAITVITSLVLPK